MFRFANPEYLYLLFLVPLLAVVYAVVLRRARRKWLKFADKAFRSQLVPDFSSRRRLFKFILVEVALALIIVMLARPQKGLVETKDESAGIEAVFVLDVSNSMLAQDVQPDRLERAKLLVSTLIDRMKNDKVALAVFAGEAHTVEKASWEIADKRTYVHWAKKKYDVIIMGLPNDFQYGTRQGRNPILIEQAIAAQIVRLKRVMVENPVIIALAQCDDFGDEEFPAMKDVYDYYVAHGNTLPDIEHYYDVMDQKKYIDAYRFNYAFHPFHAFSMISCAHIAERDCKAVYIVGAKVPGYAREMGMKTRNTVMEAYEDAKKYVGDNPNVLVLPMTFKRPSVHLCMEDDKNE